MVRPTVVIGLLGTTLDAHGGENENRWSVWRPTICICQQEDMLVRRLELLHPHRDLGLAERVRADAALVSPESEVNLHALNIRDWWDFAQVYGALFDFARAYPFRPEQEDYLVHITTGSHVAQICLFLLTEARWLPGRLLQTEPPRRESGDPGSCRVIDLDLSRYDAIAARFQQSRADALTYLKQGIPTRNGEFNRLVERIEAVAILSRDPILLTGPTGAGKSQLARRIFELKKDRQLITGSLVEVNSATLRGDQAMSALFGHVKGAYTGAAAARAGLLRKADGGVLFLDEVGDLHLDEQAMLLRALEEKVFLPVGADSEVKSDFQLIAGTNRDLLRDVREGLFREDLLARINLWTFRLPGLRDRREDIEPNLDYELDKFAEGSGRRVTMNRDARGCFLAFARSGEAAWSGNFRDLNGAVRRMATLAPGGRIGVGLVKEELGRLKAMWVADISRQEAPTVSAPPPDGAARTGDGQAAADGEPEIVPPLVSAASAKIDRFDRVQLAEVVRVCRESPSQSAAGRVLFAVSRTRKRQPNDADRLAKYLARFGLTWERVRGQG